MARVTFQALPYSAGTRALLNNPLLTAHMTTRGARAVAIAKAGIKRGPAKAGRHNQDSIVMNVQHNTSKYADRVGVNIGTTNEYSWIREVGGDATNPDGEFALMRAIGAAGGTIGGRTRAGHVASAARREARRGRRANVQKAGS